MSQSAAGTFDYEAAQAEFKKLVDGRFTAEVARTKSVHDSDLEDVSAGLTVDSDEVSPFWEMLRESRGWSISDLAVELSRTWCGGMVEQQIEMLEQYGGLPEMDHLCSLAEVYGTAPGALLDAALRFEGYRHRARERTQV